MKAFVSASECIELKDTKLEVVAVRKTNPWLYKYYAYSIKIGEFFLATKNFSRKTWSTYQSASKALLKIKDSIHIKPIGALIGERVWLEKVYRDNEPYHTILYYRPEEECI